MGKKGPVLVIGIGVAIALLVTVLAYNWLKTRGSAQSVTLETQDVAVASVDLPWGTVLNTQMIKGEPFLKKTLPAGSHVDIAALQGRVVLSPIRANEPILESRLAPSSIKSGGMAAVVSKGKRAMAVKVDKVVGVSGFVFPGNRVDILVTMKAGGGEGQNVQTKIVLENVLVLATGPEVDTSGRQEKPSQVDVITLELTPEEGEKLALAAAEGKLQLALRNHSDTADVFTRGATIPVLMSSYRGGSENAPKAAKSRVPAAPKPSVIAAPKPSVVTVELIRGSQLSVVKFDKGE
jgi:pilus assembly protein CpaB